VGAVHPFSSDGEIIPKPFKCYINPACGAMHNGKCMNNKPSTIFACMALPWLTVKAIPCAALSVFQNC